MERRIDDRKKAYEKAKEEVQGNKILVTLCIGFFAMGLLMFLYQGFGKPGQVWRTFQITYVLCGISAAVTVAALMWFIVSRKKGLDETLHTFTSGNCLRGGLLFTLGLGAIAKFDVYAIRALFVLVPVYIGLYFVGRTMPGDFTYISTVGVCDATLLFLLKGLMFSDQILYIYYSQRVLPIFVLVNIAALAVLLLARRGGGTLRLWGWEWKLGKAPKYGLMAISFALPTAILVLSLMLKSSTVCYYGVFAVAGYVALCGLLYFYRMLNPEET